MLRIFVQIVAVMALGALISAGLIRIEAGAGPDRPAVIAA